LQKKTAVPGISLPIKALVHNVVERRKKIMNSKYTHTNPFFTNILSKFHWIWYSGKEEGELHKEK